MRRREPDVPRPLEQRVLEELIYERMRASVDLCALIQFHAELTASFERAAEPTEAQGSGDFVMHALHRAWERVSEEVLGDLAASDCISDALAPP